MVLFALLAVKFLSRDPNRTATKLRPELLCDNTRLFIPWQNPPIPLRFLSSDPGCGDFDPAKFSERKSAVRGSRILTI